MKYVLFYESAEDVLVKAPLHAAEHRALWNEFFAAGQLLTIGPFADPREGAMGIFTTREPQRVCVARSVRSPRRRREVVRTRVACRLAALASKGRDRGAAARGGFETHRRRSAAALKEVDSPLCVCYRPRSRPRLS